MHSWVGSVQDKCLPTCAVSLNLIESFVADAIGQRVCPCSHKAGLSSCDPQAPRKDP